MSHQALIGRAFWRHLTTLTALCGALATGLSCREPTSPLADGRAIGGPAPAGARRAIAVLPDSMRSWTFSDDQAGTACTNASVCALVDGPAGAPMGTGSAELATSLSTDGIALVLPGFGGTRLDHVTDLRYATFRQTADVGNNLAVALQLNVDYDLADGSAGWQGRLVFEPYQGASGTVLQGTWQTWDARAGKWWGTKASVPRNGVSVANPCVQATPCSWGQLLAAFPNAGVHVTYGALVLKAGSGWTAFRGNVDALTMAVDSVVTTYDFERTRAPSGGAGYRLQTAMEDGVVAPSWSVDTTYQNGAVVTYSFASRLGRADPVVVLDDTLVAASGQISMTRDRKFQVFSDTVYSYETLQPLERAIVDLQRQILFGSDKGRAREASVRFFTTELANGTDPAALARAARVADYVASDPVTDSAAIRITDAALTGFDVMVNIYPDPTTPFDVWHDNAEDMPPIYQNGASGGTSQRTATSLPSLSSSGARRAERLRTVGLLPSGARLPGISAPASRRGTLVPTGRSSDISDYAQFPTEQLYVIYSNGIRNTLADADFTLARISAELRKDERFNNWWTTIEQHHNRTWSEEREDLDRGDSCAARAYWDAMVLSDARVYALYVQCKNPSNKAWLKGLNDLFEVFRMRNELLSGKMPSNPDVLRLSTIIASRRNYSDGHVIVVGHSEGTLLDAQAIRALPTLESHAVNFANRCVAAMALAPLAPSDQFGLDEHHVKGFLANGDVATPLSGTGWMAYEAPLSGQHRAASDPLTQFLLSTRIHYVNESYLSASGATLFTEEMTKLHKECLPKSATVSLSASTADLGTEVTANAKAFNQNDRELTGRIIGFDGPVRQVGKTNHLTAWYPKDEGQLVRARVTEFIASEGAPLAIPVFNIPLSVTSQTTRSWRFFAAANAPTGPTTFDPPPPATPPGSCSDHVKFTDTDGAWKEFSAYCETAYTLVFDPLTELPGGLSVDDVRITMPTAAGEPGTHRFDNVCTDEKRCIESAKVEFLHRGFDDQGQVKWDVVGRSAVVPVGG